MQISDAVRSLDRDLRSLLGSRMQSLVAYQPQGESTGALTRTLALVSDLTAEDLRACADQVGRWHEAGLATPLLLPTREFGRSLDAFPFEFGAILANHEVVSGPNPFDGLSVDVADLRRACEIQARSHLLHLRQAFVETSGRSDALADLVARSAPALAGLIMAVARLQNVATADVPASAREVERLASLPPGSLSDVVKASSATQVSSDEARRMFPAYLQALGVLTDYIDRWNGAR